MVCSDVCSRVLQLAVVAWLLVLVGCTGREVPAPPPPVVSAPPTPAESSDPFAAKAEDRPVEVPAPAPSAAEPATEKKAPTWVAHDEHDEGVMCLTSRQPTEVTSAAFQARRPDPRMAVKANQAVFAIVDATRCVSSSCSRNQKHACKVELSGSELRVTSHAHYEVSEGGPCTEDCWAVNASCRTPKLKPGTYTVRHGDKSFPITVPGSLAQACTR